MKDKLYAEITITTTVSYMVPMIDKTTSALDGRTVDEIKQEWFKDHSLHSYHAARESHRVGYSEEIHSVTSQLVNQQGIVVE